MNNWISCDNKLPQNNQIVLVKWNNIHCCREENYSVMRFQKGRTTEELKNATYFYGEDEWGNNKKPYNWKDPHGPLSLFGQEVSHWMPIPEFINEEF